MKIVRTRRFRAELKEICDFIKRDSPFYASKFKEDLRREVKTLPDFPFRCRKSTASNNKNIRDLIYKGYVIPYLVEGDIIYVLGIYKEKPWDF